MADPTCPRCGTTHTRCRAHNRAGNPCQKHPSPGAAVCRLHGGASPQAKKAAARRIAETKAAEQLDRLGLRREGLTPTALLAEVVERAGADLEYAATQAAAGDPDWIDAYQTILDRAGKVAKAGVDAGLAERAVQVQEAQAAILANLVRDALDRAQVPDQLRTVILGELADGLRALT